MKNTIATQLALFSHLIYHVQSMSRSHHHHHRRRRRLRRQHHHHHHHHHHVTYPSQLQFHNHGQYY